MRPNKAYDEVIEFIASSSPQIEEIAYTTLCPPTSTEYADQAKNILGTRPIYFGSVLILPLDAFYRCA
jgi:hypothetical protein